ncbi:hypothetical protein HK405_012393, partial [Cladochytrium tenue]
MDIMTEYGIGRGSYSGSYSITTNIKTKLDDVADLQPLLLGLVASGVIKPTANTYYPIHFAPGVSITQGTDASCVTFCGYHGTIDISKSYAAAKYLYYGVIADQTGSCFGGCGSSVNPLDNAQSVASHELAEMVTDPAVGLATTVGPPLGWYDANNGEIGDICNAIQFTMTIGSAQYTLQKLWSNQQNACVSSPASSYGSSSSGVPTTSTTTTSSPTATATCHSVCSTGGPLSATCGDAAACVVKMDSYCGATAWDSVCVNEAIKSCGAVCTSSSSSSTTKSSTSTSNIKTSSSSSNGYKGTSSSTAKTTASSSKTSSSTKTSSSKASSYQPSGTATSTSTTPTPTLVCHDVCQVGSPMRPGCGSVAACVAQIDTYCQDVKWDSFCVLEAETMCKANCATVPLSYTPTTVTATLTPTPSCDVCTASSVGLSSGCGSVAACVLAMDPACSMAWADRCVTEAVVYCGATCGVSSGPPKYLPSLSSASTSST